MTAPAPDDVHHDGGRFAPVPSAVVASWAPGHFAENLVVEASGAVLVSLHTHDRIDRYDPATGAVTPFAHFPTAVTGLAAAPDGALWATGGRVGEAPGRIFRVHPDGAVDDVLEVADAAFLNGCAFAPDERTLLVCDSLGGRVLAVDTHGPGISTWLADERLRSRTPGVPGANGVKVRDGQVWVSVTGSNLFLRTAVAPDGSAGATEEAVHDLRADDFAFDADGSVHLATHSEFSVVRLDPDGSRTTTAGPEQGAVGSTACAFGRGPGDETALYVTTAGGMWLPTVPEPEAAKLLRLEVGRRGLPGA